VAIKQFLESRFNKFKILHLTDNFWPSPPIKQTIHMGKKFTPFSISLFLFLGAKLKDF